MYDLKNDLQRSSGPGTSLPCTSRRYHHLAGAAELSAPLRLQHSPIGDQSLYTVKNSKKILHVPDPPTGQDTVAYHQQCLLESLATTPDTCQEASEFCRIPDLGCRHMIPAPPQQAYLPVLREHSLVVWRENPLGLQARPRAGAQGGQATGSRMTSTVPGMTPV